MVRDRLELWQQNMRNVPEKSHSRVDAVTIAAGGILCVKNFMVHGGAATNLFPLWESIYSDSDEGFWTLIRLAIFFLFVCKCFLIF